MSPREGSPVSPDLHPMKWAQRCLKVKAGDWIHVNPNPCYDAWSIKRAGEHHVAMSRYFMQRSLGLFRHRSRVLRQERMFSTLTLPIQNLFRGSQPASDDWKTRRIPLPPVEVHAIETSSDRRARTLKHLLKANHTNHSILYHDNLFHNHTPHILGSAFFLGGTSEHLTQIYDREEEENEPWKDAPSEMTKDDWRDFLGKAEYQRAFVDFFEDQLAAYGYDWKALVSHYMYEGQHPLFNSVVSGLGHPLIHFAYGLELDSATVAIEGLAMTACCYDHLHKYTDDPSYTRPASFSDKSTLPILQRIFEDDRLKGDGDIGPAKIMQTPMKHEEILLDYWNAWDVESDPFKSFDESQRTAAALVVATEQSDGKYDFFKLHVLTTSHAVRVLLPMIPASHQMRLVRQWWLLALMTYIGQGRPRIELKRITEYKAKEWKNATHLGLTSEYSTDAHYVKGIRALKVAAETWGDRDSFYVKAGTRLSEEFDGWGGFGSFAG